MKASILGSPRSLGLIRFGVSVASPNPVGASGLSPQQPEGVSHDACRARVRAGLDRVFRLFVLCVIVLNGADSVPANSSNFMGGFAYLEFAAVSAENNLLTDGASANYGAAWT